jgi:hypothetical protein
MDYFDYGATVEESVSVQQVALGGLPAHLFGAKEAGPAPDAVIFATHGRRGKVEDVFEYCRKLVVLLRRRKKSTIAVAVEQRNHGKRLIEQARNFTWADKQSNENHAFDMWTIQYGTALDVSFLIDVLPGYLGIRPRMYGITGISLGGHSTLLALANGWFFDMHVRPPTFLNVQALISGMISNHSLYR